MDQILSHTFVFKNGFKVFGIATRLVRESSLLQASYKNVVYVQYLVTPQQCINLKKKSRYAEQSQSIIKMSVMPCMEDKTDKISLSICATVTIPVNLL